MRRMAELLAEWVSLSPMEKADFINLMKAGVPLREPAIRPVQPQTLNEEASKIPRLPG